MKIKFQLIQNYLKQQIPSLLISTLNNKYLFNVPSGYQRFTGEHKTKMPLGAHFFFTKSNTATITGLTGLLFTLSVFAKAGKSELYGKSKLYADQKIFNYLEELRYKMKFSIVPISYCSWNGRLRKGINNTSTIRNLSQRQNYLEIFENLEKYIDKNISNQQQNNALSNYDINKGFFKDEELKIVPFFVEEKGQIITNYIIEQKPLRGKLIKQKLEEFGLNKQTIDQIDVKGQITFNGKLIKLREIRNPDTPSPNVLLLHYKYPETIKKILANQRLGNFLADKDNQTFSIFHIVQQPKTVLSANFKHLLSCFAQSTQHIVYSRKFKNSTDSLEDLVGLSAQVRLVSNFHKFFPLCMPNFIERHINYVSQYVGKTKAIDKLFPGFKVTAYKKCHQLVITPKRNWGYKPIQTNQKQKSFRINPYVDYQFIQNLKLQKQFKQKFRKIDPKVVFLGTGSMMPLKYRNVSSILVEWGPKDFIMLDCGQGSHIQIADHYGYERYQQILLAIKTIFITHFHSDHNMGILDLISQRNRIIKERKLNMQQSKLFLVLPANVVPWFHSFCQKIQNLNEGCEVIFIQALRQEQFTFAKTMPKEGTFKKKCPIKNEIASQQAQEQSQDQDQLEVINPQWNNVLKSYFQTHEASLSKFNEYLKSVDIQQFYPCPVIHCPQSYGIIIKHTSGVKISYSGDTRPCLQFTMAAQRSTILIHQATFMHDQRHKAYKLFHSTVDEAIQIGMESKSWKLALTHFSPHCRYQKAFQIVDFSHHKLNKAKRQFSEKHTIVCFDHLQMNLSQAHIMPYYSQAVAKALLSTQRK